MALLSTEGEDEEGAYPMALSYRNQQTHHVAAVGPFGPTNFAQRQFVGRPRVVRGGGSCVHPLQNSDLHLDSVKDQHLTTFNYSLTKDCVELAAIAEG